MSESIFCEDCGKTLMQAKGEYDHGCLDCAGSVQSEKLFWLRKEVKELKAKIKLQDQRIENLLRAVNFYAKENNWMRHPLFDVAREIDTEDMSTVAKYAELCGGKLARETLARDKELTEEK